MVCGVHRQEKSYGAILVGLVVRAQNHDAERTEEVLPEHGRVPGESGAVPEDGGT